MAVRNSGLTTFSARTKSARWSVNHEAQALQLVSHKNVKMRQTTLLPRARGPCGLREQGDGVVEGGARGPRGWRDTGRGARGCIS